MIYANQEGFVNEQKDYNVEDIQKDVRILLDMNITHAGLGGISPKDMETLTIDQLIESKLVEAAKIIMQSAPYYMLGQGESFAARVGWNEEGESSSGFVLLPANFMRLIGFQMSDWSYPVHTPITPADPLYEQQGSRHKGIRGNKQRPVVALVEWPAGLVLEFFSSKHTQQESATVKRATYLPHPYIQESNDPVTVRSIKLPSKLLSAIEYMTGALCCRTIGDTERANAFTATSMELAGISNG
jgi:hypothetical protein